MPGISFPMKHDPLNHTLISAFPALASSLSCSAFDFDTPASAFYEGLFVPYIEKAYQKKEEKTLEHCFSFLESLMEQGEESSFLVASSVLVPLYERGLVDFASLPLGKEASEYYSTWLKN